jgi:hypothetical protein
LLDADVFGQAVTLAAQRLTTQTTHRAALTTERAQLARELENLIAAVAGGGEMPTLVSEIRKREARKEEITRLLERPVLTERDLRAVFTSQLREWKQLLRDKPAHGQRVLRALLDGPIQIGELCAGGVHWRAVANLPNVLKTLSSSVASPAGFEPALPA